jgi:hypothetical protein
VDILFLVWEEGKAGHIFSGSPSMGDDHRYYRTVRSSSEINRALIVVPSMNVLLVFNGEV